MKGFTSSLSTLLVSAEQNLSTIDTAASCNAVLQYAGFNKVLHEVEDEAIAAARRHDVHCHGQRLLVLGDVGEVGSFADCE